MMNLYQGSRSCISGGHVPRGYKRPLGSISSSGTFDIFFGSHNEMTELRRLLRRT